MCCLDWQLGETKHYRAGSCLANRGSESSLEKKKLGRTHTHTHTHPAKRVRRGPATQTIKKAPPEAKAQAEAVDLEGRSAASVANEAGDSIR